MALWSKSVRPRGGGGGVKHLKLKEKKYVFILSIFCFGVLAL